MKNNLRLGIAGIIIATVLFLLLRLSCRNEWSQRKGHPNKYNRDLIPADDYEVKNFPKLCRMNLGEFHVITNEKKSVLLEIEIGFLDEISPLVRKNEKRIRQDISKFLDANIDEIDYLLRVEYFTGFKKDLQKFLNKGLKSDLKKEECIIAIFIPVFLVRDLKNEQIEE